MSGLKFVFWDTDEPVYLGQWIHQVDSLDMERGERVTGVEIWHSQHPVWGRSSLHPRRFNGKIRGLKIETTMGEKTVHLDRMGNRVRVRFCEEGAELTGMVWSFNHLWDHIQIIRGPMKDEAARVALPDMTEQEEEELREGAEEYDGVEQPGAEMVTEEPSTEEGGGGGEAPEVEQIIAEVVAGVVDQAVMETTADADDGSGGQVHVAAEAPGRVAADEQIIGAE